MSLQHRFDGDPDAPVLVLSGSIGSTLEMWQPQVDALARRFRILRFDHPGHGDSPVAEARTVGELARAALTLLEEVGLDRMSWCGLSLGGMVGMRLALDVPERLERLVLCCTSPKLGPSEHWIDRAVRVRAQGMEAVVAGVDERWFTPAFPDVRRYREMLLSIEPEGYARCCEAIAVWDVRDELPRIETPTLVICGAQDPSTPAREHGEPIARAIPGARLEIVPHAAHLANVERADAVNRLLEEFL